MIFPNFLPTEVIYLTEDTSIQIAQKLQQQPIVTSLSSQAIFTTYLQQGNGDKPIVLLHGFDSSVFEFRRLLPILAQEYSTWSLDLLGFGFTERQVDISFSPLAIKTHLYYFWKSLIGKPMILVGASMGGATAIDFTLDYPEAVEKLILINSAGLANPPLLGKFMFPPLEYLATEFLRNPKIRLNISRQAYYDRTLANADAQLCASLHLKAPLWDRALIAFTKSGGYGSFWQKLSHLQQPTLILWGENDKILGTKDGIKFKTAINNSQLFWIPECGHVPHLEKPEITAEKILFFCKSVNSVQDKKYGN